MNWIIIAEIIYLIILVLVVLRVVYDTRSGAKTLAYVLFIVMVPVIGMIFYFSFGINYRKRKLYSKKLIHDKIQQQTIDSRIKEYYHQILESGLLPVQHEPLTRLIKRSIGSPLTSGNSLKLLINGEEKFTALLDALKSAKSHIHIQYYIYEDDFTGNLIADVLAQKAREGVTVRFLYDDFGSRKLGKKFFKKLTDAGVHTAPFYEIIWYAFANRMNYRNHRKIIVIDGITSFVGGINISDRYRNDIDKEPGALYWRDTHLMITGRASYFLQYVFIGDWNFSNSKETLTFDPKYFPEQGNHLPISEELVQIASSGPDSDTPLILYTIMEAIGNAKESIRITTPYFIPDESLVDLLIIAADSGLDVQILIPGISDSRIVNAAARPYYSELLAHGVRIFRYEKGFVHAKTITIDDNLSIMGSANMDYRSFDLNFEVNAMIYGKEINRQLRNAFDEDLKGATEIDPVQWLERPKYKRMWDKILRLLSPFL